MFVNSCMSHNNVSPNFTIKPTSQCSLIAQVSTTHHQFSSAHSPNLDFPVQNHTSLTAMCWTYPTLYLCGHESPLRPNGYIPTSLNDRTTHKDTSIMPCLPAYQGRGCSNPVAVEDMYEWVANYKVTAGPCEVCEREQGREFGVIGSGRLRQ